MAKEDHWFKFFYKLFIVSTQGWKDDEVGAYIRLLIKQFDSHGVPDDPAELSKLITTYKKNWPFLSKKFKKCEDGFLRNDFMKGIREERDEKSKENKKNGSKGGKANAKRTLSEQVPNGLKNSSDSLYIYSSSPSSLEDDSTKEETVELSPDGFYTDSLQKDLELTEMQIGATIQLISITTKQKLTHKEVREKWEAFKILNFNQHRWYNSFEETLTHFRNSLSLKIENQNNGNSNGSSKQNHSHKPVITGTAPGAGKI